LRAGARRRWLFNDKILKDSEAAVYSMPVLEEENSPRSKELILHRKEDIQRQAYEEGFEAGEKAGFAEGEQKALMLVEKLEETIKEFTDFKDNMVEYLEPRVVNLATLVSKKIIIEEINTRPEIIVTMVKESLKRLKRFGTITIKINPALNDLFMRNKAELLDIHKDIIFDLSSGISVTGPVVTSEIEEVITDIDSLLNNIIDEMKTVKSPKVEADEKENGQSIKEDNKSD
jgi:flagellar assembly protein FliH